MKAVYYISRKLSGASGGRLASVIAVAGVACATIVLLVTAAVSTGFKHQIKEKLQGFVPDVVVQPPYDYLTGKQQQFLTVDAPMRQLVGEVAPTAKMSKALRQPGLLKTNDDFATLVFTAYDTAHDYAFEMRNLTAGILPEYRKGGKDSILVSETVARKLGLKTGDRLTTCFFVDGRIRMRRMTLAGLFASNFGDYDRTVAYASLADLRAICGIDTLQCTSLEINGIAENRIPATAEALQNAFVDQARMNGANQLPVVDNITHTGAMYLNWLEMLDTNVVVIFTLMCCVAAFTLISSLFILILNNITTIGILRSMGATKRGVRGIFVAMALRLVGVGLIIGDVLALALIVSQGAWGWMKMDPEMYYLTSVPVDLTFWAFAGVNIGVGLLAWLVLVLPARVASGVSPAQTMRYD